MGCIMFGKWLSVAVIMYVLTWTPNRINYLLDWLLLNMWSNIATEGSLVWCSTFISTGCAVSKGKLFFLKLIYKIIFSVMNIPWKKCMSSYIPLIFKILVLAVLISSIIFPTRSSRRNLLLPKIILSFYFYPKAVFMLCHQ